MNYFENPKQKLSLKLQEFVKTPIIISTKLLDLNDKIIEKGYEIYECGLKLQEIIKKDRFNITEIQQCIDNLEEISSLIKKIQDKNESNSKMISVLMEITHNHFEKLETIQYIGQIQKPLWGTTYRVSNTDFKYNSFYKLDYELIEYFIEMFVDRYEIFKSESEIIQDSDSHFAWSHLIKEYISSLPNLLISGIDEIIIGVVYHQLPLALGKIREYCDKLSFLVILYELVEKDHPIFKKVQISINGLKKLKDKIQQTEKEIKKEGFWGINPLFVEIQNVIKFINKIEKNLSEIK